MAFEAVGSGGSVLDRRIYFSIGGGAILDEDEAAAPVVGDTELPYPFTTAKELVALAVGRGCTIAELMADNEHALGRHDDLRAGVLRIWHAMRDCVSAGLTHEGVLPGGLKVKRRAHQLAAQLEATPDDPLYALDWTTCTRWRSTRRTRQAAGW